MVSDSIYELCLPILKDKDLDEEEKTEKLQELLRKVTSLSGTALDEAALSALWRFREPNGPASSSPSIRPTIIRRASPAPWQIPRASSPLTSPPISGVGINAPPGFGIAPAAFIKARPASASPFSSPRPSPRLAFAAPIPHSPSLTAYQFSEPSTEPFEYGDIESDTVDWIINDDTASVASSNGGVSSAASWMQSQQSDMSPYDMLRSVLGESKTDEDIEKALEENSYDLSATIAALMTNLPNENSRHGNYNDSDGTVLVGKSMYMEQNRPQTPATQTRSPILCKFWLATGQCLRADCRFSHDLGSHICKYWLMGNCLAGDTCIFSHDPSALVNNLSMNDSGVSISSTSTQAEQQGLQLQDYNSFPALQPPSHNQYSAYQHSSGTRSYSSSYNGSNFSPLSPAFQSRTFHRTTSNLSGSHPQSRPESRQSRDSTPALAVDDTEAFPSLGSVTIKTKKHHGKRGGHGHNHGSKDSATKAAPSTLADVVRMSPAADSASSSPVRKGRTAGKPTAKASSMSKENSTAAQGISSPQHIPWLQTGEQVNQQYLRARAEAIKHGGLRNKFLQSAAQAWNRNDARAAKTLSLRGQSENELMRKAHREAARILYEERNKNPSLGGELYIDLHGLHPEEAISYLSTHVLKHRTTMQPLYAITGTGHHSKNGKDKVGKAVRSFLIENEYVFREFSVPGDRNNIGGILGIDCRSGKSPGKDGVAAKSGDGVSAASVESGKAGVGEGKIRVVSQAELEKLSGKGGG